VSWICFTVEVCQSSRDASIGRFSDRTARANRTRPSLEKAVDLLMQQLKEHPPAKFVVPAPPGRK